VTPPPEPLLDEQAPACGKWPEDFERESDALLADERVRRALSELVDNDEEIRAAIVRIMRTSTGTERFERVWDLIEGPLVVALDRLSIPELMNHKCVITEELLKLAADRVEATSETRRDERERRQNALWLRRGLGGPMYAVKCLSSAERIRRWRMRCPKCSCGRGHVSDAPVPAQAAPRAPRRAATLQTTTLTT
jgi:hypothetical protein